MPAANISQKQTLWGGAFLLLVVTLLAYIPALRAGFVWDDRSMLTGNEFLKSAHGLASVWLGPGTLDYLPLTYTLLGIEWHVWGANPSGYHLVNILLHATNAFLLWRVLEQLKVTGSWWIALIFAIHPVNAASVAWIAEIKNVLSMAFYLLALLLFLKSEKPGRRGLFALSAGAFLLALLSKASVVMLPVALLLCGWWRTGRITIPDLLRTAPFFALSLVFGLITIWFQSQNAINDAVIPVGGWLARVAVAGYAAWFYFLKILAPVNLSALYPQRDLQATDALSLLPALLMAAVIIAAFVFRRGWGRHVLFGLGYFLVSLLPVLGFIKMYYFRLSPVADHWQYLAAPGIMGLAVAAGIAGLDRLGLSRWQTLAGGAIALLLTVLTWNRAAVYHNEETLWQDVLAKDPQSWSAHINLALASLSQGKPTEALKYSRRAAELEPAFVESHLNLGAILSQNNFLAEAVTQYREAVRLRPDYGPAHHELGLALEHAGSNDESIVEYSRAVELADCYAYRIRLGAALFSRDRYREAAEHFRAALRFQPGSADAHNNLGGTLFMLEDFPGAIAEYEIALRLNPASAEARENLRALRQMAGASGNR